jgi:H+/Cl- antiporter ClcA
MGLKSMQFAWLANLFAGLALYRVMNKPGVLVIVLEALALVVAMDTLMLFGQEMPLGDRQGSIVRVVGFASGFYLWLLALAWPFVALMLLRIRPPQRVRGDFNG